MTRIQTPNDEEVPHSVTAQVLCPVACTRRWFRRNKEQPIFVQPWCKTILGRVCNPRRAPSSHRAVLLAFPLHPWSLSPENAGHVGSWAQEWAEHPVLASCRLHREWKEPASYPFLCSSDWTGASSGFVWCWKEQLPPGMLTCVPGFGLPIS